ncbi:hypothetical protein [Stenotrophomonas cyclobalanopsidis]|uniref:hypothetical protein n=1 Tax=Stenotrophomonas cyclobalanopsidis TaxID=2771362 RepID=UPI001FE80DD3|nr:hypothetical protein [Stenotrophomonas cyclobalanopsidis]
MTALATTGGELRLTATEVINNGTGMGVVAQVGSPANLQDVDIRTQRHHQRRVQCGRHRCAGRHGGSGQCGGDLSGGASVKFAGGVGLWGGLALQRASGYHQTSAQMGVSYSW